MDVISALQLGWIVFPEGSGGIEYKTLKKLHSNENHFLRCFALTSQTS